MLRNILYVILYSALMPVCLSLIFSAINKSGRKKSKTMTDENFTVTIPGIFIVLAAVLSLVLISILVIFTFYDFDWPQLICYVFFGAPILPLVYMTLKAIIFKVEVRGEKLTVTPVFGAPYTFTFSEIVSAVRQVKKNQIKYERLVIKTANKKRFTVECSFISYERFERKIKSSVSDEYLFGFE